MISTLFKGWRWRAPWFRLLLKSYSGLASDISLIDLVPPTGGQHGASSTAVAHDLLALYENGPRPNEWRPNVRL